MTAPVTWFITDVLTGGGIDVSEDTLFLSPIVMEGQDQVKLPLFYAKFWAVVTLDTKARTVHFDVIKTFGDQNIIIKKLVCRPVGKSTDQEKVFDIKPFKIEVGKFVDFSKWYDSMTAHDIHRPVLTDYKTYQPESSVDYPSITIEENESAVPNEITITCKEGTILFTCDGSDPKTNGQTYTKPFTITKSTKVQAVVLKNNVYSPIQTKSFTIIDPLTPDLRKPAPLGYKLFQGKFSMLPDFKSMTPIKSGLTNDIGIKKFGIEDNFIIIFDGSITIETDGVLYFLSSFR